MIRSLKRKYGIAAPRVAVRPHVPASTRVLTVAILIILAFVLSLVMYNAGRKVSSPGRNEAGPEMERLAQLSLRLQQDNDELRMKLAGFDQQSQMDQAAHEDIVKQVKGLQEENTRLKEDLAFFQSLGSAPAKPDQIISIGGLKLERGKLPGEYRYSLLLVHAGQRGKDFHGSLEFAVNFHQNGDKMVLPLTSENASKMFDVSFRFYQRVENTFRLAPEAIVESLEVKVFEKGAEQAKLTQTVNVSL